MRRLLLLVCAMAVLETLLYSALAPLLPVFRAELGFSKAQAGLLVAMYAIGECVAAVPVGLFASRVGVKPAALTGLALLAGTSVAFGLVDNFDELLLTRFLQGIAGVVCWVSGIAWLVEVAPRQRRDEMIGVFSGAAAGGAVLGPVVGGVGALVGRAGAFVGVAVCALLLATVASRLTRPPQPGWQPFSVVRKAHRARRLWAGQWLVVLPGLLLGTIGVLAPLRLHRLGWGAVGIAATYLIAAAIGVMVRPIVARWAGRRGRLRAIRLLLLGCITGTLTIPWLGSPWVLSLVVVCTLISYGLLWGPSMASLSHAYEQAGIAQSSGFALMNLTGGVGIVVGSAAGGEIGQLAGDATAYGLTATACLATLLALTTQRRASARVLAAD